jgi:hypothetical protein
MVKVTRFRPNKVDQRSMYRTISAGIGVVDLFIIEPEAGVAETKIGTEIMAIKKNR